MEGIEVGEEPLLPAARVNGGPTSDAAFTEFYDREFDAQVRRAALLVDSVEVADDVVHDAFVAVYRRWGALDSPGGYLGRSVLNGCRDVYRRRDSQRRLLVRLVDRASHDEIIDVLDDVLRALPFNQRAAVVLRFYGQLTTDEIASQLGCAPGSVGPWIDRALTKLRKVLQ